VVQVAAGTCHSLALTKSGKVVAWGDNSSGQTNVPLGLRDVVAVAAGDLHSLALTKSGKVIAWGDNNLNRLAVPESLR
jgi:alpha-tubulin suppressor-like RCC1 family protein